MSDKLPFLLRIPLIKNIRRLWAKKILEVSAGAIVYYLHEDSSEPDFLLIERGFPFNDWVCPKGKVKVGEDIRETAIREVKEETGLDVHLFDEIESYSYTYFWDPTNEKATKTVHYFLAKSSINVVNINSVLNVGNEALSFKQLKFFTADEAIILVKHQVEKEMIAKAKKKINDNINEY